MDDGCGNGGGAPVAVDRLEALVLVDNHSDSLSTVPEGVTPEFANLIEAGARELSGDAVCCPHYGFSLLLTAFAGGVAHTVLFDTGPEGFVIERNASVLGVDLGAVEDIVLSHGHWDHAGGTLKALDLIRNRNGGHPVAVHVNSGMFAKRALRLPDGAIIPFREIPDARQMSRHGAEVVESDSRRLVAGDTFYLSGAIPRLTAYEKGLPGHLGRSPDGRSWDPDPWLADERYLAVNVRDKGLVVFTACSHAGVVNVLMDVRDTFRPLPVHAVMGGFHLAGAAVQAIIPETMADLGEFALHRIAPGHCTGWRALHALVEAFGEQTVAPVTVGSLHAF